MLRTRVIVFDVAGTAGPHDKVHICGPVVSLSWIWVNLLDVLVPLHRNIHYSGLNRTSVRCQSIGRKGTFNYSHYFMTDALTSCLEVTHTAFNSRSN